MKHLVGSFLMLCCSVVSAEQMATATHIAKAAKSGQLMVVYSWPCADIETGLALINEMIDYESGASPHPYSAVPAVHEDGALASIDIHSSQDSFEAASEWQNNDPEWQRLFVAMADACGSADDLSARVMQIQ